MKRTYILAGIVLLIFLFGCSRYDDGPWISFRSAKKRVLGTWKVEKLLINDLDSTELYREQIGCEWEFTDELFYDEGDRWVFYYKNCYDDTFHRGLWYFNNSSRSEASIITDVDTATNPIGPIGRGGPGTYCGLQVKKCIYGLIHQTIFCGELLMKLHIMLN